MDYRSLSLNLALYLQSTRYLKIIEKGKVNLESEIQDINPNDFK